jgi:hypothetical protein
MTLGLSAVQSMGELPDANSIQDNRANMYGGMSRRESVLQKSARNNLQL